MVVGRNLRNVQSIVEMPEGEEEHDNDGASRQHLDGTLHIHVHVDLKEFA